MQELKFKHALLATGWANDVSIQIDAQGIISNIEVGAADTKEGCLIPGLANLHSHAHQRAMAGLAERAGPKTDSFWTWRKIMYQFIDTMKPHQLHAIASQLYLELLLAGYTRVAEFQYLHHNSDGGHYENIAEMSLQTLSAADQVGIGITSIPVHYQFAGFGNLPISAQQARFYNEPSTFLRIVESLEAATLGKQDANIGVAGHSLRATNKELFNDILTSLHSSNIPVHMHIAEQIKEINDCINWSGSRPVDYCLDNFEVNPNWCLVHATHMSESETLRLANSGAVAGICPSTEANLGDGLFNANQYLDAGGKLGIGSDSHVSTSPVEELRWLEYGQRLLHNSRNQLSGGTNSSTGRYLFDLAASGGAQACGINSGTIDIGLRADFILLDTNSPTLVGRSGDQRLDSWIFSGNNNSVSDVYVGGKQVVSNGCHRHQERINHQFRTVITELTRL